jgi:hypothetical protein
VDGSTCTICVFEETQIWFLIFRAKSSPSNQRPRQRAKIGNMSVIAGHHGIDEAPRSGKGFPQGSSSDRRVCKASSISSRQIVRSPCCSPSFSFRHADIIKAECTQHGQNLISDVVSPRTCRALRDYRDHNRCRSSSSRFAEIKPSIRDSGLQGEDEFKCEAFLGPLLRRRIICNSIFAGSLQSKGVNARPGRADSASRTNVPVLSVSTLFS